MTRTTRRLLLLWCLTSTLAMGAYLTRAAPRGPVVDLATALTWHKASAGLFLDARPYERFATGHVAGALHLPPSSLEGNPSGAAGLRVAQRLVLYGEGPDSAAVARLAELLRQAGFVNVAVMREGWAGWQPAGHPQEASR